MIKRSRALLSLLMIFIMTVGMININVDKTYAANATIKLTGANYPQKITMGKSYSIKGKIVSSKKINRVEIGIVNASTNKWTAYKYDNKKVNAKTFNIKKADTTLKFGKLAAGKYYYRIYAHIKGEKVKVLLNKQFTVTKPASKSNTNNSKKTTTTTASGNKTNDTTAKKSTNTNATKNANSNNTSKQVSKTTTVAQTKTDKVTLSGYNYPTKYNVGKPYSIKGKITCNNIIRRVEIGIVVNATNKWCEYKYDNTNVNARTFDIAKADTTLRFGMLPGGSFRYRIYVHTDNGVSLALNKPFTVVPSGKPRAAVNYAIKIANDNRYTYGKGYGGYFNCCICAGKTQKREDAQFTCMPFLAAAYAHGTNHPSLVNGGRHVMNLHDGNFKGNLGKAWFKLGLCKDLKIEDLQPGDVIIKWSSNNESGHAWMYGGGDMIIEATPTKTSADEIATKDGAASKLRNYGKGSGSDKNYVMRYRGN